MTSKCIDRAAGRSASAALAGLLASMIAATASAQATQQVPSTPQPIPVQPATIDPSDPNGASPRFLFAAALAMIIKTVGANVASSLTQGIVNWFSSSPGPPVGDAPAVTPWVAPAAGVNAGAAAGANAPGAGTAAAAGLYAGIAFEVHLVGAGGSETAVDPAAYVFRSGERLVVYYRLSLPGRVHVFNVSPSGEVIPIESLTLAAGQLAKLGPYLLTDPAGDEALRLVLEPCSSPQLVAATRNIVKAGEAGSAVGNDVPIPSCLAAPQSAAAPATRNIVKAAMDGGTGFALDAVSSQELATGRLAARETNIAVHHR
jgi:hypothetical protein